MEQKQPQASKEPLSLDERLLQITLDQLRTLETVKLERSIRGAAKKLGRDQSSIDKQLRTLESHFRELAGGELLIRRQQRGSEVDLTNAGLAVAGLARAALHSLDDAVDKLRNMQRDHPLRLAMTTFLLPVLLEIQDDLTVEFARRGLLFHKEIINVQSSQVQRILLPGDPDQRIDFSLGGFTATSVDNSEVMDELDFLELKRDRFVLLTNFDPGVSKVLVSDVRRDRDQWPLILPRRGVIWAFVEQVWGNTDGLRVVEWCNHVHFTLELLSLGVRREAMLAAGAIAEHAHSTARKVPLYVVELDGCDSHLSVGLFRRKTDAITYLPDHPRSIFWNTCMALSARSKSPETQPRRDTTPRAKTC